MKNYKVMTYISPKLYENLYKIIKDIYLDE